MGWDAFASPRLVTQNVPELVLDAPVLDKARVDDGTGEAIARLSDVRVLQGTGTFNWNGGMWTAFPAAVQGDNDYYLWLNDDVRMDEDAAYRHWRGHPWRCSAAPSMAAPERPLCSRDQPRPSDTMAGNAILVPRDGTHRITNIDPAFVQLMGDFNYGLRARAAGYSVWLAHRTVGTCTQNSLHDDSLRLLRACSWLWSTKELALGPRAIYIRLWVVPLPPVYWISPYAQRGVRAGVARLRHRTQPPDSQGER